jgi:hypothetical protein
LGHFDVFAAEVPGFVDGNNSETGRKIYADSAKEVGLITSFI